MLNEARVELHPESNVKRDIWGAKLQTVASSQLLLSSKPILH
jgi:hypothetical protein